MPPLSICDTDAPVIEASGAKSKSGKTVRFCDSSIRVYELPAISVVDRANAWLDKADMTRIRKECIRTIQRVMNRSLAAQFAHEPLEIRGLEAKMPYGVWRRQQCRKEAMHAVLKEQQYQQNRKMRDPEWISALYQQVTHRCEMEAKVMGKRDEMAARRTSDEPSVPAIASQLSARIEI